MDKRLIKTLVIIGAAAMLITPFFSAVEKTALAENGAVSEPGPGGPDGSMGPGGQRGPGGPGGLGGPGGPGNMGAETKTNEPVVSLAKSQLADFGSVKNQDAVIAVYDFGLMDSCSGANKTKNFCSEDPLTFSVLAKAVAGATLLVQGGAPSDYLTYCTENGLFSGPSAPDKPVTGYDAARMLLSALGVKDLAGDKGKNAIEAGLKRFNLTKGIDNLDLSKVISRDNGARMIANALSLSDRSGYIPRVLHNSPVHLGSGTMTIDNTRIFNFGGSAIQNSGESVLVIRNSRVDGDTSVTTKPLAGNPGGLLVAGSIRTTLALGKAQAFYINSKVISKDWAALSTDGATMVTEPGQTELSVYAYGSSAKTRNGGYGAYSDLFCNVYLYGTKLDSAEIGIISGTYGKVTVGTIGDGEDNKALTAQLIAADKRAHGEKSAGSAVTGGRNAIMIHSVNLPPYWKNKGYSKEELPLLSGNINIHGSALATDLSLGKNLEYPSERQAYINHHAGSVILIKSSNTDIILDNVTFKADKQGTGALIHTVINNDSMFMIKVPEGEIYPGVKISMKEMKAEGNILNEDYQRDMQLSLTNASLTGRIISGTAASWNVICEEKGFENYIIDTDGYNTVHGVNLTLNSGSVWNVTGESTLTALIIGEGAIIAAPRGKRLKMIVNGTATSIKPGVYKGNIVITVPNAV